MQLKFIPNSLSLLLLVLTCYGCASSSRLKKSEIDKVVSVAQQQYQSMLSVSTDLTKYPRTSNPDGSVKYVSIGDWTGGF